MNIKIIAILIAAVVIVSGAVIFISSGTNSEKWESTTYTSEVEEQILEETTGASESPKSLTGLWGQELILIYTDGTEESVKTKFDNPLQVGLSMMFGDKEVEKIKFKLGAKMTGAGHEPIQGQADSYYYTYKIIKDGIVENTWKSSDHGDADYVNLVIPVDGKWHDVLIDTMDAVDVVPDILAVGDYTFSISHSGTVMSKVGTDWYSALLPAEVSFEFQIKSETGDEVDDDDYDEDGDGIPDYEDEDYDGGDGQVEVPFKLTIRPDGAGTNSQLDDRYCGGKLEYQAVSDNDDSTGVSTPTTNTQGLIELATETYQVENIPGTIQSIDSVTVYAKIKNSFTTGESGVCSLMVTTAGNTKGQSVGTIPTGNQYAWYSIKLDNNIVTENSWTGAELDNLEAGVRLAYKSGGGGDGMAHVCSEIYVEVEGTMLQEGGTTLSISYDRGYVIT